MKIRVLNGDFEETGIIDNVDDIKACNDGRFLIHFLEKCECCGIEAPYIQQVPLGYFIQCLKTD